MANEIIRSSVIGGNKPIATLSREGLEVGVKPISELVIFSGKAIDANSELVFDLNKLTYPVLLNTLFIADSNTTNTYTLTIRLNGVDKTILKYTEVNKPCDLKNLPLLPGQSLKLSVVNAIAHFSINATQMYILDNLIV